MGEAGSSRAEVSRARLLDAAVSAFADKGFHGTTTRDIAAAADMSAAALYVHHRSKEELLHLISLQGHDATLALVREAIASSDEPAEQVGALAHAFALHHARELQSSRVVNYELAALTPEHRAEIRAIRRQIEDAVRDLVERGVRSGDFTTTRPRVAAVALLSLSIDIARWFHDGGEWTPEELADAYAELALRIVGATG